MWAEWEDVDTAGRMEVIKDLAANITTWPEDVQRAALNALAKGGVK
jgi:hypothetical protein